MAPINVQEIKEEIEQAITTDKYDSLFTRSCNVSKTVMPCFESFLDAIQICMSEEEKQFIKLSIIIARALLDFACSKSIEDFEKIIDTKSDECYNSKEKEVEIEACAESIITKYFSDDEDEDKFIEKLLNLLTKEEDCIDLVSFESCVASVFKGCTNKFPIEVLHDLLQSVIEQTPCRSKKVVTFEMIESNKV